MQTRQLLARLDQVVAMSNKEVVEKLAAGESPVVTFSKIGDWKRFLKDNGLGELRLEARLVLNEEAVAAIRAEVANADAAKKTPKGLTKPAVTTSERGESPVAHVDGTLQQSDQLVGATTISGQPPVAQTDDAWPEKSSTTPPPKPTAAAPVAQGEWD